MDYKHDQPVGELSDPMMNRSGEVPLRFCIWVRNSCLYLAAVLGLGKVLPTARIPALLRRHRRAAPRVQAVVPVLVRDGRRGIAGYGPLALKRHFLAYSLDCFTSSNGANPTVSVAGPVPVGVADLSDGGRVVEVQQVGEHGGGQLAAREVGAARRPSWAWM